MSTKSGLFPKKILVKAPFSWEIPSSWEIPGSKMQGAGFGCPLKWGLNKIFFFNFPLLIKYPQEPILGSWKCSKICLVRYKIMKEGIT